jgi:2-polyprenyl-6-methoxyphenol hydroxylase-like FAD-dependent oxidoreductase
MKNVGIIGGGIGGVATAAALGRFGIRATVYERAPQLKEAGAGMMLWPNATFVLENALCWSGDTRPARPLGTDSSLAEHGFGGATNAALRLETNCFSGRQITMRGRYEILSVALQPLVPRTSRPRRTLITSIRS